MSEFAEEKLLQTWLQRAGLPGASDEDAARAMEDARAALNEAEAEAASRLEAEGADRFLSYRVPRLASGGACSLPDVLEPEPFALSGRLPGAPAEIARVLAVWTGFLERVNRRVGADWLGLYMRRTAEGRGDVLLKIAYIGTPSRAEFPLTEEFAARSNNSLVGLGGKAVSIDNVEERVALGGPYYACDGRVLSELCVPVFGYTGTVTGIIDAESFKPRHFCPEHAWMLGAAALLAGRHCPYASG